MNKGILKSSLKISIILALLFSGTLFSQVTKNIPGKNKEEIGDRWNTIFDKTQQKLGLNIRDFHVFKDFYEQKIDSQFADFRIGIREGYINQNNIQAYIDNSVNNYVSLYKEFKKIKREYPSSVAEAVRNVEIAKKPMATCDSACDNIDFEDGTLNGWSAYYSANQSTPTAFNFTVPVGGPAGAVTQAGGPDAATGNDYQVQIMSGSRSDALIPSIPVVSPFGGKYSVRLGDSTNANGGAAILTQTFKVTPTNKDLIYQYAIVLDNPPSNIPSQAHTYYEQPFFTAVILDQNGDTIPGCGTFTVASSLASKFGFSAIPWTNLTNGFQDSVYYKNWSFVFVPLDRYIGQCVTVQFMTADCYAVSHFGYAYIDAVCGGSSFNITSSSPNICSSKPVTLTAPPGASTYKWSGTANGIVGSDTTQTITVDSVGTYQVVLTSVIGSGCTDTLSITVDSLPNKPPVPFFTADTVCNGNVTTFTNKSNPDTTGDQFYWDLYGSGFYQDSSANPTITYTQPGIYNVTLHELAGGCGADTTLQVMVDTLPMISFNYTNNVCSGRTVTFTNNSTGATGYTWNFGDSTATSNAMNPTHVYGYGGTYTVTLVAVNANGCTDSLKQVITIRQSPILKLTSTKDSICPGLIDTLAVSGASTYRWSPGNSTNDSLIVTLNGSVTYTVTGRLNGCTSIDSISVDVLPAPGPVITASANPICPGTNVTLSVTGGSAYKWLPSGKTTDSITVAPTSTTSYSVIASDSINICTTTTSITVNVVTDFTPGVMPAVDSVCPNSSVVLTATGGTSYSWSTGATTSSITVSPTNTGTTNYSVTESNMCFSHTVTASVYVYPLPTPAISSNLDSICAGTNAVLSASGGTTYTWSPSTGLSATTGQSVTASPGSTTTYTVTAYNGSCGVSASYTLKVIPLPVVSFTGQNTVCPGTADTITASGGGTYSWITPASTSNTISPVVTANTTYSVTVTKNGCSTTAGYSVSVFTNPGVQTCCDTTVLPGSVVNLNAWGTVSYQWSPSGAVGCYTCPTTTTTINGNPGSTVTYTVVGTDANGCVSKGYITITLECQDFVVPNIFTPNGDQKNEFLVIQAIGEPQYTVTIYDRWGRKVFTSSDPSQPWNGKINNSGADAAAGVYYYVIKSSCGTNNYDKHGFVQLIR